MKSDVWDENLKSDVWGANLKSDVWGANSKSDVWGANLHQRFTHQLLLLLSVAGLILYCLIKYKIVRCCVEDNQAHVVEQGGMALPHLPSMGPLPGPHPPAPTALQLQALPLTHNMTVIENSLARMQLQYSALASQLASQKTDQKTPGASGASGAQGRNQYPMV